MNAMRVDLAYFDGDVPLGRLLILVHEKEETCTVDLDDGGSLELTYNFEEPASPIFIKGFDATGKQYMRSAMRMGVHNSYDWENIQMWQDYQLIFKCAVVDGDREDWVTQTPLEEYWFPEDDAEEADAESN
jgi:hypothetical protein